MLRSTFFSEHGLFNLFLLTIIDFIEVIAVVCVSYCCKDVRFYCLLQQQINYLMDVRPEDEIYDVAYTSAYRSNANY